MDDKSFELIELLYAEVQKGFKKQDEALQKGLGEVRADVAALKTDVAALKSDLTTLKTEVTKEIKGLKIEVSELKTSVLKMDMEYMEYHKDLESKVMKHEEILLKKAQ